MNSLVRHCAPPSYSCVIPRYGAGLAGMCATCSYMLARGDFAQDVPQERYDLVWATTHGSLGVDRYAGLLAHEARALMAAMDELRELGAKWRAADEAWHEAETSPDAGLFYDYGRVAARWYNED